MTESKTSMRNVGVVIVLLNMALAIAKTLTWIHTDSLALFSEATNSWIDTIYSILILLGIYISTKDPTEEYPEGYRRIEPFIAIIVGTGVIITALFVGYNAIQDLINGNTSVLSQEIGIVVLTISGITKYVMYKYCMKVYESTNSPILAAVGTDNRNDILTIIIALVGVFGSLIGFGQLDVYSALLVAVAILYSGITILRQNAEYVLGRSVPKDTVEDIKNSILDLDEVKGIHDVKIHYSGPHIDISMHLEVSGGLTIEKGHEIEQKAVDNIKKTCEEPINEINLHIDPESLEEWK